MASLWAPTMLIIGTAKINCHIYAHPHLFEFRSFMLLICRMIQKEFSAASTPSSWLFLDYRFVTFVCLLFSLVFASLAYCWCQNWSYVIKLQCLQAGKIILHYRDRHRGIMSRFFIWGFILVSSVTSVSYLTLLQHMLSFYLLNESLLLNRISV